MIKKYVSAGVIIVAAVMISFFLLVTSKLQQPMAEALEAMGSDAAVTVRSVYVKTWIGSYYAFEPANTKPLKGLIFYQGAFVDPRAYAPALRLIAEKGYLTVLVGMPFDIAFFGYERALKIMKDFPDIEQWAIGGHSLGGISACRFAKAYPQKVVGVMLWASGPSERSRLDNTAVQVTSLYGTNDGIVTIQVVEESRSHLPVHTRWVEIPGGNHTQFGWYANGCQRKDNPADISLQAQQNIVVNATLQFMNVL